jgi:hypothetical protein
MVTRVLDSFRGEEWPVVSVALTRLADHLLDCKPPIDYRRRRECDYSTLLPDDVWLRLAREHDCSTAPNAALAGRLYLYERLCGLPFSTSGLPKPSDQVVPRLRDFLHVLTPELQNALDRHCLDVLTRNGVTNEPISWHPDPELIADLPLPGRNPVPLDFNALHRLVRLGGYGVGAAAERFNVGVDVVENLLDQHPAPADRARASDRLARNVSSGALDPVERNWLFEEYVNRGRTLAEIGRDRGVSDATIGLWAKRYDIPRRPPGSVRQSSDADFRRLERLAPSILMPALDTIGGWRRLQLFEAISAFSSFAHARRALRTEALSLRVGRLERDLGQPLLIRAMSNKPQELTEFGRQVIEAIRELQDLDDASADTPKQ